jgi:GNAT superfamily N-acetyltransferase
MDVQIYQPVRPDLPIVLELLSLQFKEHQIEVSEKALFTAIEAILADERLGFFLLARLSEQAVGLACVSFCWTLEHGGRSAWLDELYVLPEYRSRGIGGLLIKAVLQAAKAQGCAAVDLEVDHEHRRAEQLYQRFGFDPLSRSRWVREL